MKYKITVIKYENNDNYEAEMAKFKESRESEYNGRRNLRNGDVMMTYDEPQLEKSTRALEVFLTEEEYKKVKEEVVKVFQ